MLNDGEQGKVELKSNPKSEQKGNIAKFASYREALSRIKLAEPERQARQSQMGTLHIDVFASTGK
jgi:hypothetical protein